MLEESNSVLTIIEYDKMIKSIVIVTIFFRWQRCKISFTISKLAKFIIAKRDTYCYIR
jgi:hypothetical protein